MEVDSDDDLIETLSEARSKGPPPDVTHHLPNRYQTKNNAATNSLITKMHHYHQGSGTLENQPLLAGNDNISNSEDLIQEDFVHLSCNFFEDDPEFTDKIKQVETAIDKNIFPQRIYEGSSGSYFAKNIDFVNIFLFIIIIFYF
jgi:hypothetical protein